MKNLMIITILASMFSIPAFAEQTKTECPMMSQSQKRTNPKAGLTAIASKQTQSSRGTKVKGE